MAVLITVKVIAEYLHVAPKTVIAWAKIREFPLSWLPDGRRVTTSDLINSWLLARRQTIIAHPDQRTHQNRVAG